MRYVLFRRQLIPRPLEEVFPFFAEAGNLEAITPRWLAFRIVHGHERPVAAGTRLIYRLRLFGIGLRWVTVIERFRPGHGFVDTQVSGPYRSWVHSHTFTGGPQGTFMEDRVDYQLPLGILGALAQPVVALQLRAIFRHRRRAVSLRFGHP
jgi:ligand-binding SRPBCC domain-containing protein